MSHVNSALSFNENHIKDLHYSKLSDFAFQ